MKRASRGNNRANSSIRIIAGAHRGRKLPVLSIEGLRPTSDRQKETLFNWLMNVSDCKCLDMFAGTGSLGIEALSRGARNCTFIEQNKRAALQIEKNVELLKFNREQAKVINQDAIGFTRSLSKNQTEFDLIFIDPPFSQGLIQPAIDAVVFSDVLSKNAYIYVESERNLGALSIPTQWQLLKNSSTSQAQNRLYKIGA